MVGRKILIKLYFLDLFRGDGEMLKLVFIL